MLRIVGDCNYADGYFDTGIGTGSSIGRGANPFQHIRKEDDKDFWIGNFECVCASVSDKTGIASRQFIIPPDVCDNVRHLDLYGVANNHVMQHGAKAYNQMLDYIENRGVLYAGTRNKPTNVFEHQTKKIAVTAFSLRPENFTKPPQYWSMPEYNEILEELAKYDYCDYRIVYVHWGVEFINYPYCDQKQFAHFLVDVGADLVIGMHPHVLQGYEIYNGKYIFYSLGNCVFNMPWEPTRYSLLVNLDLESGKISYDYLHIGNDFFPEYAENVPEKYSMGYLNTLIDICEDNEKYFLKAQDYLRQYRRINRKSILKNIWKLNISDVASMMKGFISRRLS